MQAMLTIQEFDATQQSVATDAGQIAYREMGEGPAALFIHGVFLNGHLWRKAIDQLREDRRCIAIDLPAHGATEVKGDADLSLPGLARVVEAVCDELGLDQVDLVGNDTGGAVAQVFAANHPGRLRTLTLTNCDTHDNLPPEAFEGSVAMAEAGELAPLAATMLDDLDVARSEAGLGVGYEHPENLTDEEIRTYGEPVLSTAEAGRELERFITSLSAEDLLAVEPELKELTVPTLVVWGTGDVFFDVSWAHWLRDTVPGVTEVVEVPGAKLFFPDERPQDLVPHVRRHWAAHQPAG
jgi:pimeloyl-ACP methyl ester carboxylesterase